MFNTNIKTHCALTIVKVTCFNSNVFTCDFKPNLMSSALVQRFFFVDKPITRRETYPKLFTIMMLIQKENSPTKKSASRSLFAAACILFSIFSVDDLMNLI